MTTDLVTGGAGFVGSELVAQLVAAGRRVRVLDDLSLGRAEAIDHLPGVELHEADVRDDHVVAALLAGVDTLYHLACVDLRRSLRDPASAHAVNATGTLTVLEAVRRSPVRRVVHVSSSEVYGDAARVPMDEDHPTRPTTAYGASKLAGEAYARAHHTSYGVPVVVVRPFNAVGPGAHRGPHAEVLPRFVEAARSGRPLEVAGDGTQTRDFTHVADVAEGLRAAAGTPGIEGRTFNLGSGAEVSVLELADLVRASFPAPVAVRHVGARPGDVRRHCADARRAATALGFRPSRGLRRAVAETVALGG